MAYVVTQPCCADASCVLACPVNCIHPAPGEPGFGDAEMVYIDASTCVGCGACVTACPVGAIKHDEALADHELVFADLAHAYYANTPHADRAPLVHVGDQRRLTSPGPFRVAIVGAGPAGLYAADALLTHPEISVEVFDRLDVPHGLARHGVAPDHPRTREIARLFEQISGERGFTYRLGVDVGSDLGLAELQRDFDAVIYATGASDERLLGIDGEQARGVVGAVDLVGWYNDHPDQRGLHLPEAPESAVVIGNGNVALDVARMLTLDACRLDDLELAPAVRDTLAASPTREVTILGRRGPEHAAFTTPELIGLGAAEHVDVLVHGADHLEADDADPKLAAIARLRDREPRGDRPIVRLRFGAAPTGILDLDGVATGVRLTDGSSVQADLVVRAIGFRGRPVADLPFDDATGRVPNDRGAVTGLEPGVFVAGWIKRGPSGFIGTNKTCAAETVERVLDHLDTVVAPQPDAALAGAGSR